MHGTAVGDILSVVAPTKNFLIFPKKWLTNQRTRVIISKR